MSTSAVPGAIDYLVATITALCADPVVVADGYAPVVANGSLVLVGVDEQTGETQSTSVWAALGAKKQDEVFEIPLAIYCHSGDSSAKEVRDAAFAIFNPIRTSLVSDPTLGGVLQSPGIAEVTPARLVQTFTDTEANAGRLARIYFTVHCQSRLTA